MAANPDSILDSTKQVLGIDSSFTDFDIDVIMHINTVLMTLNQMGVGPADPFLITDSTSVWTDFTTDMPKLAMVKTYTALKVRLIFDPPATSFTIDAYAKLASEYEFRLNVAGEQITPPSDPFGTYDPNIDWL
jgi:hypothetical protein